MLKITVMVIVAIAVVYVVVFLLVKVLCFLSYRLRNILQMLIILNLEDIHDFCDILCDNYNKIHF